MGNGWEQARGEWRGVRVGGGRDTAEGEWSTGGERVGVEYRAGGEQVESEQKTSGERAESEWGAKVHRVGGGSRAGAKRQEVGEEQVKSGRKASR